MRDLEIISSYKSAAPVKVEAAIRALGLRLVRNAELPEGISGQIMRLPDGTFEISTNKSEHYFRQRFTMAHELGHYVLHRDLIGDGVDDDTLFRSTTIGNFYNTRIMQIHEQQANSFAANFLMPTPLLLEEVDRGRPTLRYLMLKFQVSPSALRWRLKSLGIERAVTGE